jgi:hypothetical protein
MQTFRQTMLQDAASRELLASLSERLAGLADLSLP